MAYADVSKPVVIQASKTLSAKVDNYLRRMCIVSQGESSLDVGGWKEIPASEIDSILNTQPGANSEGLKKKLNGFFAFAPDKDVVVVEVGAFDVQNNPISEQVKVLEGYINNAAKKSYIHYVPHNWYWPAIQQVQIPNSTISVGTSLVALRTAIPDGQNLPQSVSAPTTSKQITLTTNIPSENLEVEITPSNIASFDKDTNTITALAEGEGTIVFSGKLDMLKGEAAMVSVDLKIGAWNQELTLTVDEQAKENQAQTDTTNNGVENAGRDLSFLALADKYTSMAAKSYFFIEMDKNEDPSVSEAFAAYANKKSVFAIFDNFVDTASYPLASCILGICASARYDLSGIQRGTPLNFKVLSGQNYKALKRSMVNALIQAPANFAGDLAGNPVVLNGRYTDGTAWEYYYQWDFVEFEITLKLQTLLLNGVNSSSSVVTYSQTGIDILKANIKSVLLLWQENGVITAFSKTIDPATGKMVGEGDINSIDFEKYIVDNQEDYKNEIYKGFSFYLMIGRYPRQIFIEATLN